MKLIISIYCVLLYSCNGFYAAYLNFEDRDTNIQLMLSGNGENHDLNKEFVKMAKTLGFSVTNVTVTQKNEVWDTLSHVRKYSRNIFRGIESRHVINLKASGYCDAVDAFREYGDSVNCICEINECPSNQTVTIFSESIMKYNRLYKAIISSNYEINDNIIVCLPNNLQNIEHIKTELRKKFIYLSLKFPKYCENGLHVDTSVLAIVTPARFRIETRIPTIIYNNPYFNSEDKDNLPTSIILMTDWKSLNYAILNFLKSMHWYRVAVLSDDSEDSAYFLKDLLPVLDNNGIIYTAQQCNKRNCDFFDAASTLQAAAARVVILNINYRSAAKIINFINHNVAKPVKWIVRDWPFRKSEKFQTMHDLFSFTLSPVFEDNNTFYPYVSGIDKSLKTISNAYTKAHGDIQLFSKFFLEAANYKRNYKTYAHIMRKADNINFKVVTRMIIHGTDVEVIDRETIYSRLPPDILPKCIIRSKNFFKPCNDEDLVILLCVVIMFILTLLIIIIYFTKYRNNMYKRLF